MRFYRNTFIVLFLVITSVALAQRMTDEEQVRAARSQYNDAISHHDVPAIVSFLDEDYQVTTSLGQLLQGRENEANGWRELIAKRQGVLYVRSPESIEISKDYPLAAETGNWSGSWSTAGGGVQTGGRYSAMWRKVDGQWKVRSELFVALFCDGIDCP